MNKMNRDKELKKEIILWLFENENVWQRVNACTENFRDYIYDKNGNYLIGGENVADFIRQADNLLYREKETPIIKIS
jgi:hypothetical protein